MYLSSINPSNGLLKNTFGSFQLEDNSDLEFYDNSDLVSQGDVW
jgi:hypothetical protein